MSTDDVCCWNCGASLAVVPHPISRHEQCPECFEALHCCRLCRHYGPQITGHCDEERADPPVVKENANFCDWFQPSVSAFSGATINRRDGAENQLNALFTAAPEDAGTKAESDPEDGDPDPDTSKDAAVSKDAAASIDSAARAKLDQLFGGD